MKFIPIQDIDSNIIAKLHIDCWHETYAGIIPGSFLNSLDPIKWSKIWTELKTDRSHYGLICEISDQPIGLISAGKARDTGSEFDQHEIYAIYIKRQAQKLGIGQKLICDFFDKNNVSSAYAWVLAENPSRKFYEKIGGKLIASRKIKIGNIDLDELAYSFGRPGIVRS